MVSADFVRYAVCGMTKMSIHGDIPFECNAALPGDSRIKSAYFWRLRRSQRCGTTEYIPQAAETMPPERQNAVPAGIAAVRYSAAHPEPF
jgi:hypothetical protein